MPATTIERLALRLSGVAERDAQRLALLIAEGLAASRLSPVPAGDIGTLRVQVTARSGDHLEQLAQQVVAEIMRELARTV
jgi:hypothetical protein